MNFTRIRRLVGRNVRRRRKRMGLTQEALSERANFSYKYLQEIEGGRANVTLESLARISKALKIHPGGFFQNIK